MTDILGIVEQFRASSDELIVSDDDESPKGRPAGPQLDVYVGRYTTQHSPSTHSPSWNDDDSSRPWDTPIPLPPDPHAAAPPLHASPAGPPLPELASPPGTPFDEAIELSDEDEKNDDSTRELLPTPLVLNCSPLPAVTGYRWRRLEAAAVIKRAMGQAQSLQQEIVGYERESWSEREVQVHTLMRDGNYEKAVQLMEGWGKRRHSEDTAVTMKYRLALCHRELNNFDQMEALFKDLLQMPEAASVNRPPQDHLYSCLGNAYLTSGNFPEAVGALEQCYRLRKHQLGPQDPKTMQTRERLAEAQRAMMTRTL